ncbi:MAG: hypothetical protein JKY87_06590 [Mariprofundus sp.]|nr:hypothetical protein [Mariprofundus sp.]
MTEKEKQYFEVLMEEMNGKFSLVLEGHDAICKEFNGQLDGIKEQQTLFMLLLKGSHDELKEEIQGVRTELKEEIQGVRTDLKEEIQGVQTELKEDIRDVRTELREMRDELSAKIEAVGGKVNGMDARDSALGYKIDGHEDRIRLLETKAA